MIILLGLAAAGWFGYRAWHNARDAAEAAAQAIEAAWSESKTLADDAAASEDFDRAISICEDAARRLAGSEFESVAREKSREFHALREQAESAAWAGLVARAEALAAAGDWTAAEAVYSGFDGSMASRLADRRAAAAEEIRARARAADAAGMAEREAWAGRRREALDAAAAALFDGEIERAAALVRAVVDGAGAPEDKAAVERTAACIDRLRNVDASIAASFAAQRGAEIEMIDGDRSIPARVADVRDGKILLELQRGAGWATFETTPDRIPFDERRARLSRAHGDEIGALWAGLEHLRAGRLPPAAEAFADAGDLATGLTARVEARLREAEEARAAAAERAAAAAAAAQAAAMEEPAAMPTGPVLPVLPPTRPPRPLIDEDFQGSGYIASILVKNPFLSIVRGEGVGGSRALQARYEGYEEGSRRIGASVPLKRQMLEATLCFDVRFAEGFQFVKGGKLLGLGPTSPITGGNPMKPAGWSARMMWGSEGTLQTYLYCQNKEGQYGQSVSRRSFRFTPGGYHAVTLHVKLNDPPDQANGFAFVYVDGTLEAAHEGVQFRAVGARETLIQQFMFSSFHGGHTPDWAPRKPDGEFSVETAWFDNIAIYPGPHVRPAPGAP